MEQRLSITEFQRKFPKILDSLPVIITKFGKDFARIEGIKQHIVGPKLKNGPKFFEEIKPKAEPKELGGAPLHWTERAQYLPQRTWNPNSTELCQKHPGSTKMICGCP